MTEGSRTERRRAHDDALRALDAARRARRRREALSVRLESARARAAAAVPAGAPPFSTFAAWEGIFRTEDAAERDALASGLASAVTRAESAREAALLEEAERSLPAEADAAAPPRPADALEAARSESRRALLAVEGDRAALAEALRSAERGEWQLARCRDCLAPVKIDFLFDLRGGGFHRDLASSGRLDQAREYALGARVALVRAEVAAAAVSGAALPIDDEPFSPARLWGALLSDFATDGYVTSATGVIRAMVDRLHALVAPLRARARDAERDALAVLRELEARTRAADSPS